MLGDYADFAPATVVLLTGDGAGYRRKVGFHTTLERMQRNGWKIEVLSWEGCCNKRMRRWVESCGIFVPLDNFYHSVTFLEHGLDSEGRQLPSRYSMDPPLGERPTQHPPLDLHNHHSPQRIGTTSSEPSASPRAVNSSPVPPPCHCMNLEFVAFS